MKTKRGKIAVTFDDKVFGDLSNCEKINAEKLLKVEMYLNDKIALDVFKKFGVLIRVHL